MAVNENQLITWSGQGSIIQSRSTYSTIRSVLEDRSASYSDKSYEIFLQGSYGNDTNIFADSDVDVVIKLNSTYYYEDNELSSSQRQSFTVSSTPATYSFNDFKNAIIAHLKSNFNSSVIPGNKAIFIKGNGTRRDSDVLVATQYRKYIGFTSPDNSNDYIEGICFWDSHGNQIINYPKKHLANCTDKHQRTRSIFKPMVRILKNMRNDMVSKKYILDGAAPSYFIEGMLYNVPENLFVKPFGDTFANAFNWLNSCDLSDLVCANEQYYLLHPYSLVTWRSEKMQQYLNAVIKYWQDY